MKFNQSVHGCLFDDLQVYAEFAGDFTQQLGVAVRQRADKADGVVLIVVLADIPGEEVPQIVRYQLEHVVVVKVVRQEVGECAQEAVGERTVVDRLHDLIGVDAEFVEKVGGHVFGRQSFQYVRQEELAQHGAAAFVAQDVASRFHVLHDDFAIVEA